MIGTKEAHFTVAVIEDDESYRSGLVEYLDAQEGIKIPIQVDSVERFLWEARHNKDLSNVLLDQKLPGISGIRGIPLIRELFPDINIVILSMYENWDLIYGAFQAGANGYILKSTPMNHLIDLLMTLRNGGAPMSPEIALKVIQHFHLKRKKPIESPLTLREQEVVFAIMDGLSYKGIAERLMISVGTVFSHIKKIYAKVNVHSKVELINKKLKGEI